jgi:MipA family protein
VKKTFRRENQLRLDVASTCFYQGASWAGGVSAEPPTDDDLGSTVLSDARNVAHWGLRAAAGIERVPYKGCGTRFTPIPLVSFESKWVHAFSTTLSLKIGKWSNVSFALCGKFAMDDEYKQWEAPSLNGMQDRDGAFWYGPALSWYTAFGTVCGDFLAGGNKGQMPSVDFSKSSVDGNLSLGPHLGAEWAERRVCQLLLWRAPIGGATMAPGVLRKVDLRHVSERARRLLSAPDITFWFWTSAPVASWQRRHRRPAGSQEVHSAGQDWLPLSNQSSAASCRELH